MVKVNQLSARKQAAAIAAFKEIMDLPKTPEGDKAAERATVTLLEANVLDLGIPIIRAIEWVEVQDFMQAIDPNGDWLNCPAYEAEYVNETLTNWIVEGGISKRVKDIVTIIRTELPFKEEAN